MLRLTTLQPDFWDHILPPEARRIGAELEAVDVLLDDPSFLAPFQARFRSKQGRYTIPMETYLRLMYLKVRYQLGYESLMAEVNDSVSWRRFCRISLSARVPDASTLIKLTNGPCKGLAGEVHAALVGKLAEKKVLRGRKLRVDTTVVEANIHYPTDIQLLADGARVVTRAVRDVQKDGVAGKSRFRDARRSIKRRLQSLGKGLKQPKAKRLAVRATLTAEVLSIVKGVVRRAEDVFKQSTHEVKRQEACVKRRVERRLAQLGTWLERTRRVIEQASQVLQGNVHLPNRLVSLFDPDARPIRKGKLAVAGGTEFGYKAVIAEEERGFVTYYDVTQGNPGDVGLLTPAVEGHITGVGRTPRAVATDRGMASAANERRMHELGVRRCSLPKSGKKGPLRSAMEHASWFRRLQRFRAGGEARISLLKRRYGWRRSLMRGWQRAQTWTGWGVIGHNLTRYARLQAALSR
jgi:IS5 family transposase